MSVLPEHTGIGTIKKPAARKPRPERTEGRLDTRTPETLERSKEGGTAKNKELVYKPAARESAGNCQVRADGCVGGPVRVRGVVDDGKQVNKACCDACAAAVGAIEPKVRTIERREPPTPEPAEKVFFEMYQ